MNETVRFPRLDVYRASSEWTEYKTMSLSKITERMNALDLATAEFYHTGRRASDSEISSLRNAVVEIARDHGFPQHSRGRRDGGTSFDRAAAATIRSLLPLAPAEASRTDIWNFINLRVLLDVLVWRWGSWNSDESEWLVSHDRLFQLTRTAFGRLWWRVELLGSPATSVLSEDQCVQLMERPRLTSFPPLARQIADRLLVDESSTNRDDLLRVAIKRLGRRMAVTSVFFLRPNELEALVDRLFVESAEALQR